MLRGSIIPRNHNIQNNRRYKTDRTKPIHHIPYNGFPSHGKNGRISRYNGASNNTCSQTQLFPLGRGCQRILLRTPQSLEGSHFGRPLCQIKAIIHEKGYTFVITVNIKNYRKMSSFCVGKAWKVIHKMAENIDISHIMCDIIY